MSALASSLSPSLLLHRIRRQVPVEVTETVIGGKSGQWLKVIDPDRLLEQALACRDRAATEVDPFWAATWRAASGLERFLDRLSLDKRRVLELGCGSGRVGIGAALRGGKVTMTDAAGMALLVARWNAQAFQTEVEVRSLEWKEGVLPGEKFDVILGSDIVYEPALHPILEPCLRRHLKPGGAVYLSEPQRHTGDRFRKWILAAGWNLAETLIDLEDDNRPIRIFSLRLPHDLRP